MATGLVFKEHYFESLRGQWPQTAARDVPLVVYRDVIDAAAQQILNHHHDFCSLYIIRSGKGMHIIDGVDYAVARGDVYVMGLGMPHHFHSCAQLVADTIHFSPAVFDRTTLDALSETPGFHSLFIGDGVAEAVGRRWLHLTPAAYEAIMGQVAELRAEWKRGTLDGTLLTRALFTRLLIHLSRFYAEFAASEARHARADAPADGHEATIAAAVRYMEERFAEPLRIEQVAAQVFLSPDRFTEVFSKAMGRTPRDYLRHLRLERAKTLLASSEASVAEVARLSGFTEAAYLTRVLRAATGLTPRAYRKRTE
jgi:AraC family L-rhamnose operon regulatory protein RhaS